MAAKESPGAPLLVMARPAFKGRNPYSSLLYRRVEAQGARVVQYARGALFTGPRPDVLHLHWPDGVLNSPFLPKAIWKMALFLALLHLAKRRGVKLFWTVHDLGSHERNHPKLEALFWRRFIPLVDGYFCLSEGGRQQALARWPALASLPGTVVPHGHYRGAYPDTIDRAEARARLGLAAEARVALFLGQIRRYKNLPRLIEAFRALEDPEAVLIIAGEPRASALRTAIEEAASGDRRIELRLAFVPDEALQVYLHAADLTVLPYAEILNSGSALLALSYDCPVLVPDKGALAELQRDVGADWVRLYDGELGANDLGAAFAWSAEARGDQAPRGAYDWDVIAKTTQAAYRQVLGATH
ncbi:MAG: glycosyltransferase [Pseudomonadota bacterium]